MTLEREKKPVKMPPPRERGAEEGAGAEGSQLASSGSRSKAIASRGTRLHPSPSRHLPRCLGRRLVSKGPLEFSFWAGFLELGRQTTQN